MVDVAIVGEVACGEADGIGLEVAAEGGVIGAPAVVPRAFLRVIELAGEAAPPVERAQAARVLVGQDAPEGVGLVPFPAALVAGVRHRAWRIQMIAIDVIVGAADHHAHGGIAEEHRLFRHAAGQAVAAEVPSARLIAEHHMAGGGAVPGFPHPLAEIVHPVIGGDAGTGAAGEQIAPVIGIGDAADAGDVARRVIGRGIGHCPTRLAGELVAAAGVSQRRQRLPRHAEGAPIAVGVVAIELRNPPGARPARQPIVRVIPKALVQCCVINDKPDAAIIICGTERNALPVPPQWFTRCVLCGAAGG